MNPARQSGPSHLPSEPERQAAGARPDNAVSLVQWITKQVSNVFQRESDQAAREDSVEADFFRAAVESSPIAMVMVDPRGTIVLANRTLTALLGYEQGELLGKPLEILVPERFRSVHSEKQKKFSADRSERIMSQSQGISVLTKEGSELPVEIGLNPIQTPEGVCVLSTIVDLEERRRKQIRMATSDRMAAVGTLAAGVSHSINNPLAYVIGNLSFAIETLTALAGRETEPSQESERAEEAALRDAGRDELIAALVQAKEGSERIASLVNDLIAFSSKDDSKGGTFDLDSVVRSTLNLTSSAIEARAQLVTEFGETHAILGEAAMLAHVLLNLLVNAVQSMPPGHPEKNEIRVRTWTNASGSAVIEIRDSGPGIPPEIRERIFEPFFSTKTVGEGTGLGLSIAHGVVSRMGGGIEVDSVLGEGSTFRVIVPTQPAKPTGE
jgi:PAS domain S-box-containing protein